MSTDLDIDISRPGRPKASVTTYKILIIGDSNVGKTSLLNRYCEDSFQGSLISTVGIDYKTNHISLDGDTVKLQIWDTAGQERFRTLTNAYFRGACGAVLLYDITSRESFTSVVGWMESVVEHGSSSISMTIVGHKSDLDEERIVTAEEGKKLAENYDSLFFEASAKTGDNCSKIFSRLASNIKAEKECAASYDPNPYAPVYQDRRQIGVETSTSSSNRVSSCC